MTSNTGLMASLLKPVEVIKQQSVDLQCCARPAPFILRPFAGLYNPFSYGCSILCNHPADAEIKDVVKRAKDAMVTESKLDTLAEEMAMLRKQQQISDQQAKETAVDFVHEELFKRYTDTDSRPLTPAPTLASAVSWGSLRRRCLTPDQPPPPRQTLVLDLRRSHSQETLCWHGFHASDLSAPASLPAPDISRAGLSLLGSVRPSGTGMPPLVSPVTLACRSPRPPRLQTDTQLRILQAKNPPARSDKMSLLKPAAPVDSELAVDSAGEEDGLAGVDDGLVVLEAADEDVVGDGRRRGRRRRGRNRLMSAALIAAPQTDPETQIAGIGTESHNPSSRGSISAHSCSSGAPAQSAGRAAGAPADSFIEAQLLTQLQREVDEAALQAEFDPKRRCVLSEALRTRPDRAPGPEMQALLRELQLPPVSLARWLHLPRVYSRQAATFQLPPDRHSLQGLLPMQYISEYITVSSSKQLLYQTVLQKFHPDSFCIHLESIKEALQVMMGESLDSQGAEEFSQLMQWDNLTAEQIKEMCSRDLLLHDPVQEVMAPDKDTPGLDEEHDLFAEFDVEPEQEVEVEIECLGIHFRSWCGLCALCERLNGVLPPIHSDPPHEVEVADFDTLESKMMNQDVDKNLVHILNAIQKTHSE